MQKKINHYRYVLILFIILNILNIFASRGGVSGATDDGGGGLSRTYIQFGYIMAVVLMIVHVFPLKRKNPFTLLYLLIFLIISYIIINSFVITQPFVLGFYVKFLVNLVAIIYFWGYYPNNGNDDLLKIYCISFLAAQCIQILTSGVFENEKLGAGDTASLGLVFLYPLLILSFRKKSVFLIALVIIFVLISIRRTSILAILFSSICLLNFKSIKISKIFLYGLILLIPIVLAYDVVGEQMSARFGFMLSDEDNVSAGSGREFFYAELLYSYITSGFSNIFMGHGLGSIGAHFEKLDMEYLNHAHNDYLELLYTFGLFGLSIWIGFLLYLRKVYKKSKDCFNRKLYLACIVNYMVIALFSGCLLRIETLPFMISLAILIPQLQNDSSKNFEIVKT